MARGSIARGSLWNLAGFGAPIAAALIAVPLVIRGLGTERFGILALAWAILGAAAMLDLGFGRALTQIVAKRRATGETAELHSLVMTATVVPRGCSGGSGGCACWCRRVAGHQCLSDRRRFCGRGARSHFLACSKPALCHLWRSIAGGSRRAHEVRSFQCGPYPAFSAELPGSTRHSSRYRPIWYGSSPARYWSAFWVFCVRRPRTPRFGPGPWAGRIRPRLLQPILALAGWMAASTVVAAAHHLPRPIRDRCSADNVGARLLCHAFRDHQPPGRDSRSGGRCPVAGIRVRGAGCRSAAR